MNAVKYSPIFDKLGKLNFKRKKKEKKIRKSITEMWLYRTETMSLVWPCF